jgi:hypothetical protein
MDHPIMADLKAARAKAWERLRSLVGQRAYLMKHPDVLTGTLQERVEQRKVIETEIKEFISILTPGASIEFAAYEPGNELDGLKHVIASEQGFRDGDYKWITTPMSNPIAPPIDQPAEPDDLDDPLDKLLSMGD